MRDSGGGGGGYTARKVNPAPLRGTNLTQAPRYTARKVTPTPRYTAVRKATPVIRNNSGGGYSGSRGVGGGYSNAGVGSNAGGVVAPMAAPPAPPMSIEDWLAGDSAFKSQEDLLAKALADYQAQRQMQEAQYTTDYTANANKLKTNRTEAFSGLEDDYAGRGLLTSGLYAKAFQDLTNDYDQRQAALDTDKSNFLANLALAQQNFVSEQDAVKEKAKQEALARRAAQYGV